MYAGTARQQSGQSRGTPPFPSPYSALMKRPLALMLTTLALLSGVADAGRRSGGGFGGSRSSGGFSAPRSTLPRTTTPRYTPPGNISTAPRTAPSSIRTPSTTQRSTASSTPSAANRAAAVRVTPAQLRAWKNVKLPAGVPRTALTYSAARSAQYPYQLAPGRYFPYPPSYYRRHGIGADLLKYALIFTAVSGVADALDGPDVTVTNGNVATQPQEPNLWSYAGVGLLAAAAAWVWAGRRRR